MQRNVPGLLQAYFSIHFMNFYIFARCIPKHFDVTAEFDMCLCACMLGRVDESEAIWTM